ncbi:DUF397 domain-containing protein [Streptomyces sp. NPDC059003]|uniref:DUF397 domain-containing protein n=1 Tax=Streptomyces sp. NPDC059003 TaxID=3346691 RepID=UPI00368B797A
MHTASSRTFGEWFKSSYSSEGGTECVETCPLPNAVRVRDSKQLHEEGPVVTFTSAAWSSFTRGLDSIGRRDTT